ncbi:MAG: hypothetical protein II936_11020 [Oscillospiraceae bacterium]|nr:hypothetical protein [Oscillospiraceae bacterium]
MLIPYSDAELFFSCYIPLLDFVNKKKRIIKNLGEIRTRFDVTHEVGQKISTNLWEDRSIIDEFLEKKGSTLSDEQKEIISGFSRGIYTNFMIKQHLPGGSIFVSSDAKQVYLVKSILSEISSLFKENYLPMSVKTVLLPFKDYIITDGLFTVYKVTFGGNVRNELREVYLAAKKNGKIIESF